MAISVSLTKNGKLSLELAPGDEIEKLVLAEMVRRAAKGQGVALSAVPDTERIVVSVEE